MNFAVGDGRLLSIGEYVGPAPEPVRMVPLPACWFILRTRPLREFKVRDVFEDNGVSFYLPVFTRRIARYVRHGRSPHHVDRRAPLFPGLMFIPDFEVSRLAWLKSFGGVAGMLHLGGHPARLTTAVIANVRAIEAELARPLAEQKRRYAIGQPLRITGGYFEGWKGRITRLDGKGRIRVLLEAVKREIPVEITEDQVEPV